jgi:FkbM family methyltransferase
MIQRLLCKAVKLTQYVQGIGAAARADKAVLKNLKSRQPPLVIFDVGANRGHYLQLALKQPADIHAFEPSTAAFAELTKRFGGRRNVVLNNLALGSEPGQRTLYYDVPGSELSSLYPRKIEHHGHPLTQSELVPVDTLDHYCDVHGIEHIDLLKLDVEGHELAVLKGSSQMFGRAQISMVSFEFGGCNVDSRTFVRDFFNFFAARGMRLARVTAFGRLHRIPKYEEGLEQFRTTCFVATRRAQRATAEENSS